MFVSTRVYVTDHNTVTGASFQATFLIRLSQIVPAMVLLDRGPHPLRRRGHADMVDPVFAPEAFDDRIDDRGARPDRAGFARALHAERIGSAGYVMRFEHEGRPVRGAIDRLLHQSLPDPLHRSAMDLACQQ